MSVPTLQEVFIIEEMLAEADEHGLRQEVIEAAESTWQDRKEEEDFTLLDAYHLAYQDWVK